MKYTPSNHQTKGTLIDYFKETHDYRRNVIKTNNLSITNIVEEYPQFKDTPRSHPSEHLVLRVEMLNYRKMFF